MSDLTASLARALGEAREPVDAAPVDARRAAANGPVLQLNRVPVPVDLDKFRDAFSAANPTGDYTAAYRFRELSNVIPTFTRDFYPSLNYVEKVWRGIVFGATGTSAFIQNLLSEAQVTIKASEIPNQARGNPPWLSLDASPSGWVDQIAHAQEITLELGAEGEASGYVLLGEAGRLVWTVGDGKAIPIEGRIGRLRLRMLQVNLNRNWFDFAVLSSGAWYIAGEPAGHISSGKRDDNPGLMPLLPTALLVGTDVNVEGDWSRKDKEIMDSHVALGIGPFPIVTHAAQAGREAGALPQVHLIGYLSALVPYVPKAAK